MTQKASPEGLAFFSRYQASAFSRSRYQAPAWERETREN